MTPKELYDAVVEILDKHQRPTDKLELKCNYKKGSDILTSARIQFKNASYTLISANYTRKSKQINVHLCYEFLLREKLLPFTYASTKSDTVWLHVDISAPTDLSYIEDVICKSYDDSPFRESFACCGLYEKCSDEKKCIHKDLQYAKACQYRKNLESGRIFYGKNRNI